MNESETSTSPDHETFMRLWVQHQPQVYAYIRALVFCRADAEDVLQEVAATNRSVSKQRGKSESAISRALDRIYLALLQCIRGKTARQAADGGAP